MTKFVRDVQRSKYERSKALVLNARIVGFIFLVGAAIWIYQNGWMLDTLPIVYTGIGAALLLLSRYLKRRWKDVLAWSPDKT